MWLPTPKNKDIEKIYNRLTRYPVTKVKPKVAQAFSRQKRIRYLSKNGNIFIKKGVIAVPDTGKIIKKGTKFFYEHK